MTALRCETLLYYQYSSALLSLGIDNDNSSICYEERVSCDCACTLAYVGAFTLCRSAVWS